jgi:ATP-dependent DNA ligase
MPLIRVADPFDHPDWFFELKHDGFRALAQVDSHQRTLMSRRHIYKQFPQLQVEIAHSVRAHSAVLDGEIVCLGPDGRSLFNRLLFRRDWPHFVAFEVLSIDGEERAGCACHGCLGNVRPARAWPRTRLGPARDVVEGVTYGAGGR